MKRRKLKGIFKGEFRGRNINIDSISKVSLENIDIYNSSVNDVEFIDDYNLYELQNNNENSLIPISMSSIKIFSEGNSYNYFDISNSIITDIQVKDIVVDNKGSVGVLEGIIYTTLLGASKKDRLNAANSENEKESIINEKVEPDKVNTPPILKENEGFSWNKFLLNALLFAIILGIIYFIWCFTIGPCKKDCNCNDENNQITKLKKELVDRTKQDSLNLLKKSQDSLKAKLNDSTRVAMNSGVVEITLNWSEGDLDGSDDDLDLKLVTPSRDTIWYKNKNVGNVYLDVDANNNANNMFSRPVEHIYIPFDANYNDYKGRYTIIVDFYQNRNTNNVFSEYVNYNLSIKNQNKFYTREGIIFTKSAKHDSGTTSNLPREGKSEVMFNLDL